jgi:hypothetical protein
MLANVTEQTGHASPRDLGITSGRKLRGRRSSRSRRTSTTATGCTRPRTQRAISGFSRLTRGTSHSRR